MLELGEELAGALADRYVIERELGRGGMAIVFLARDLKHNRRVAIKVLRPELSTSLGAERFLREITIAARLTHPNILSLHDSGDARGMLYFVMPYVEGESLRRRLDRERQLPVNEAIAIARQVAAALDYAHAQGVVHRDIKPENILLIGDHALVADFGLARAVYSAASPQLTESGVAVGTPAYISPEQASAERSVDGRTDVYSLACVVFEMIAGVPPYRGATAQAVIAHHIASPPPSLCGERASCPAALDASVQRALAKVPADRFRTAGEFVRSLEASGTGSVGTGAALGPGEPVVRRPPWRRPLVLGSAAVLVVAVSAGFAVRLARGSAPALDASRVVALPLTMLANGASTDSLTRAATQRLGDALGEWSDVHVVDDRTTREAVDAAGNAPLRTAQAMAIARRLGAGRMVWGDVASTPESVTVRASLYDVSRGQVSKEARITYPAHSSVLIQPYRELVNTLLRDRDELPWTKPDQTWPASLAAWSAYDSARNALDTWDLAAAEARLRDALRIQPEFPQAELWLAQVLSWATQGRSPEATRRAADEERALTSRALQRGDQLNEQDRTLASGLLLLAQDQFPRACDEFRSMSHSWPDDFRAWFGLGDCQSKDVIVIANRRSPSGYVFRGSWETAASAYEHALQTLPAQPPNFVYFRLAKVLMTEPARFRIGRDETGQSTFVSPPLLISDTLAFVPYPSRLSNSAFVDQRSVNRALQSNVDRLSRTLRMWVRLAPRNPLAHEMLADVLEEGGVITSAASDSVSAMSQIRAARELTTDSLHRRALGAKLVRLAVKADSFGLAAELGDSLLNSARDPSVDEAQYLVGIAALLGNRTVATRLLLALQPLPRFGPVLPDGRPANAPPAVLGLEADALVRASLGICDDSLRTYSSRLDALLPSYVPDSAAGASLRAALTWPVFSAAVSCLGAAALNGVPSRDVLVALDQAYATGGREALRSRYESLQRLRQGLRPGDVAVNYTYAEAWLLQAAGDTAEAVRHLDLTLNALPTLSIQVLDFPSSAAALVRAMALRAELGAKEGERRVAARWAQAVVQLWSRADPELDPVVARMRRIARATQ